MPPRATKPAVEKKAAPAAAKPKAGAAAATTTTPSSNTSGQGKVKTKGMASAKARPPVFTESLRATDAEKHATSKSLYGDSAARISSNVYATHDYVRHRAYEALFRSIKGKTMLHLGCGMGLHSMLAARAGASQVIALDTSAVVNPARVVAEQNNLANVTFIRGRLRDVLSELPAKKFDVVLCEWMGTFLLNEDILSDVLYARDNLLAENGILCPNTSSLHVVGVADYNFRLDTEDFWSNVYGFKMEPMKALVRSEVETCSIPAANIMTSTFAAFTVDVDKLSSLTETEKKDYERNSTAGKAAADAAAAEVAEKKGELKKKTDDNPVEAKWTPYSAAQKGIEANFTLSAIRDCTINYLTFYVDASFTSRVDTGANFVLGIRPGGANAWTEVSVGLLDALPVKAGEKIVGRVKAFTPLEKGGRVTVVQVSAKTEGKVVPASTTGEYYYQSY